MKNGGYQVMIVIPENFSKLAMQLDAKTPSKISLQYKTAVGQKEEVAKNTEKSLQVTYLTTLTKTWSKFI